GAAGEMLGNMLGKAPTFGGGVSERLCLCFATVSVEGFVGCPVEHVRAFRTRNIQEAAAWIGVESGNQQRQPLALPEADGGRGFVFVTVLLPFRLWRPVIGLGVSRDLDNVRTDNLQAIFQQVHP